MPMVKVNVGGRIFRTSDMTFRACGEFCARLLLDGRSGPAYILYMYIPEVHIPEYHIYMYTHIIHIYIYIYENTTNYSCRFQTSVFNEDLQRTSMTSIEI